MEALHGLELAFVCLYLLLSFVGNLLPEQSKVGQVLRRLALDLKNRKSLK